VYAPSFQSVSVAVSVCVRFKVHCMMGTRERERGGDICIYIYISYMHVYIHAYMHLYIRVYMRVYMHVRPAVVSNRPVDIDYMYINTKKYMQVE